MVVITLIGIVTAMILPEMRGTYEDALLRSSARKLVSVCNLASTRAITLNQPYRLTIDGQTGKFVVRHWARNTEEGNGFVPARDVVGGEDAIDPRIAVEVRKTSQLGSAEKDQAGDAGAETSDESDASLRDGTLTFQPDGTADPADIALRDRQGFALVLRINPTTGRVRIIEPGAE